MQVVSSIFRPGPEKNEDNYDLQQPELASLSFITQTNSIMFSTCPSRVYSSDFMVNDNI